MGMVRRMRMMTLLAVTLLGLVAMTAAPVAAGTAYKNSKIAITIADGWEEAPSVADGMIGHWIIDGDGASFSITLDKSQGLSSVDYAVKSVDAITSLKNYKELRRDFVTSGDQQSPRLDYLFEKDDGTVLRAQQVFITNGADAYIVSLVVTAVDHSNYVDDVDAMVASLTFL